MKKILALVLSIALICSCAVTAFAAASPVASKKLTITFKKAEAGVEMDVAHTIEKGSTITVKANTQEYGKLNSWSVYKLAADGKYVPAVEGVDYVLVAGNLTTNEAGEQVTEEVTVQLINENDVVVCGNYNNVITDPTPEVSTDTSPSAPKTGDMTVVYALVVMLVVAAFGFGAKKIYSK